jgi:Fusaric acid resistance protein family
MSSSAAAWSALRLDWWRQDLFGDLRVRHGIKLGLAGLLALFWAQALRLPDANWAILTALVLMNGQYVGAFAFKAIMRFTGTVAGALVGVWLASDYSNTSAVFLPIFFLVMAFAGYKFGQVGARQVPYAYFLLGLTTLTVATDGVTNPGQAWYTGLVRTEEIFVGIICSLFVSTLVWPRYAREEFLEAGRAALKTVDRLVSTHTLTYLCQRDGSVEVSQLHDTFDRQFSRLRNLLQAGARESAVFSARLADYNSFMVSLSNLFHVGLALNRHRGEAWFLEHVKREMESLFEAVSEEFNILTGPSSPGRGLPPTLLKEKFVVFEAKVTQMRGRGMLVKSPLQTAMDFAGEFALLRWLTNELNNIRGVLTRLPSFGQNVPKAKPNPGFGLTIDWFWVKVGIKGAVAAVIAIVLLKWIHPPGAANVPTWAWLFVVLRRTFLRLGSGSDLRGFQTALVGSLILAGCAVFLIALTPLLASYAVMNFVLFLVLFATGFFTANLPGLTFWSEFTFLTTSAFIALNPQVPVSSQTIIDTFVGTMFGLWIGTLVSRLIWPLLPQRVLRDSLLGLFVQLNALLGGDHQREIVLTQLTTLPMEALAAVRQIRIAGCSEEERARLAELVRSLQTLISRVSQLVSRRNLMPEIGAQMVRGHFERLEVEFKQMLDAFAECFRQGDCRREMPAVQGALGEMDHAVQRVRDRNLLGNLPPEASLRFLDIVDLYHATADAFEECSVLISSLRIERYWGDLGL